MAIQLKPGTVVQFKSGGPKMTVVGEHSPMGVASGKVWCEWFEGEKPMSKAFSESTLKIISED
jgi:uncharacterized protein YodC (DUF2158 family)